MKAVYRFVTGEVREIEVSGEVYEALAELDREEKNGNRRETRRHVSLDALVGDSAQFVDDGEDVLSALLYAVEREALKEAISQLLPQQRELVRRIYLEHHSLAHIAAEEGVSYQALQNRLARILKSLRKFLREGL